MKKEYLSEPIFVKVKPSLKKALEKALEKSGCETMAQFYRKIFTDFLKQKKGK